MQDETKRVLLVEDEPDISMLYKEVLEDAGYTVVTALDGDTGLDLILEDSWDLLLLDIMLPGRDGVQILKKMQEEKVGEGKPVILLTNLGSENIINTCFSYGADGYLIKSEITSDKIVSEVQAFLEE